MFTFRPATRDRIGLLFAIAGASGSGKTYSALLLAKGLANGSGKIFVIDTEAGRAKHYADRFTFHHGDFDAPFTPERYVEAIKAAEEAGATVIVIDSMSHEWNGEGGCSDMQSAEAERMATDRDGKVSPWKIEAMTAPAWKKPKIRHKRMMSRLLQSRAHLIFCLRAEEKVKFVKETVNGKEKTNIVPQGFMPICEKEFMFEMSGSMTMHPDTPGTVRYDQRHKLNEALRSVFPDGGMISEETGKRLREWAEMGADTRVPQSEQKIIDGARDLAAKIEDAATEAELTSLMSDADVAKRRAWLRTNRPDLSGKVEGAYDATVLRLSTRGDAAADLPEQEGMMT